MNGEQEKKKGINFDMSVNLGHILTFVGFIVVGFASWSMMDKRVLVLEEARLNQAQVNQRHDLIIETNKHELSDALNRINDKLDRLIETKSERK